MPTPRESIPQTAYVVNVGTMTLAVEYIASDPQHGSIWQYWVASDHLMMTASDLHGPASGHVPPSADMMQSLVSFLSHAVESGNASDGRALFPHWVYELACKNSDELSMFQLEGEDMPMHTVWVCTDCMIAHANDEWPTDSTVHPLSYFDDSYSLALGMAWDEHSDDCPNRAAAEYVAECDCETRTFSRFDCEGCGSSLAGTRHALTVWRR